MGRQSYDLTEAIERLESDDQIKQIKTMAKQYKLKPSKVQNILDTLAISIPHTYEVSNPPVRIIAKIQENRNELQKVQSKLLGRQYALMQLYNGAKSIIYSDSEISGLAQATKDVVGAKIMKEVDGKIESIDFLLELCEVVSRNLSSAYNSMVTQFEMIKYANYNK